MPPVKNPPKNEIAQITIRITAMMYNKFPMLNYFFKLIINKAIKNHASFLIAGTQEHVKHIKSKFPH